MIARPSRIPADVFISQTETLPRELVASCARHSCGRCHGAGWFWFTQHGARAPFMCPCAQKKLGDRVSEARKTAKVEALPAITRKVEEMIANEESPAVVLCGPDVASELREKALAPPLADGIGIVTGEFQVDVESTPVTRLRVVPDPNAPPAFAHVFSEAEFKPYLRELLNQQAERLDDAKREAKAAEELAAMRAETAGSA